MAEKIVCPSVRHIVFRKIGWTDFDEIWHEDVEFNSKKNYRARFSIPDTVPDRWPKKCHFWRFLANISRTSLRNFLIFWYDVVLMIIYHLKKTACPGKIWFRRYAIPKIVKKPTEPWTKEPKAQGHLIKGQDQRLTLSDLYYGLSLYLWFLIIISPIVQLSECERVPENMVCLCVR